MSVQDVKLSGEKLPVIPPLSPHQRDQLKNIRNRVQAKADELGIEPALIASKRELEIVIRDDRSQWPEKLKGWRSALLGEHGVEVQ